ncbi:MAG: hypothetical protein KDK27_17770 [Leptospiraceae bacterium]|nr:hypothetical protein [Leptospiraceae bacterium]
MGLLDAGHFQVFQNHAYKIHFIIAATGGICRVDQLIVFIHAEHAMRREAFHGKGAGNPNLFVVLIRFIVEVFVIRFGGDGRIDFLLAADAVLPPFRMELSGAGRPVAFGIAGNFPFRPVLGKGGVEFFPQRLQFFLIFFPDDIDFRIVGDGFEGDMRHPFIHETPADVAKRGCFRRHAAGDFRFL